MYIKVKSNNTLREQRIFIFIIALMSIFLNQSNVNLEMNVSLSDVFLLISILLFILKRRLVIPTYQSMFFLLLSFILLMNSVFYAPYKFNFDISYSSIIKDYIKLLASFLFFLFGYNISHLNMTKVSVKWYSIGAMTISLIGLLMRLLNINYLNSLMYYGNFRFRGLMNDPNYYSVIQCTALVYFLRQNDVSKIKKMFWYLITFVFIAMSGSKTGMITLMVYSIFIFLEYLTIKRAPYNLTFICLVIVILLILMSPFLNNILNKISELFPSFKRIQLLFEDFSSAKEQGGSGRNEVWKSAIGIIKTSPLIGIGLGSYITINSLMFMNNAVAHNTYLQILAEWGGILGGIFFGYVFLKIAKTILNIKKYEYNSELFITRDIVLILLIGSLAISLNNARMFWLFLGELVYSSKK